SQCTVVLSNSLSSTNGNSLVLKLSFLFAASFSGNRLIYLAARDTTGGNSGWETLGVAQVPGGATAYPIPAGVTPSTSSNVATSFTFKYEDQTDANNLQTVWVLINDALDGRNACYIAYYRPGNQILLVPDDGDGTQPKITPLNGNSYPFNSQCEFIANSA